MKLRPRAFQEGGIDFLASRFHAYLGDQPGLGKTPQALGAVEKVQARSILVICPASVVYHWQNQIVKFLGREWLERFTIISYNSLHKLDPHMKWDVLICDEAHYLKTLDSKRTQQVLGNQGVARRCRYKWMLSGTPVLNRPKELYPILKALWGHKLGKYATYTQFIMHFCGAFYDGHCINDRGASNLDELRGILEGFMLRRTQKEVLPELPDALVQRVPIELSKSDWQTLDEVEAEIEDREEFISTAYQKFSQMGDSSKLLRLTGIAKAKPAAKYIGDQLDVVEKVLVFGKHRDAIDILAEKLARFHPARIQGGMSPKRKEQEKNYFIDDPRCQVLIGNIQAAGTGIDGMQTVCNTVVFAELSWVPGETEQCIDRVKRMGLMPEADRVNVHILHTPGTLESAVLASHDGKVPVINRLMGSVEPEPINDFDSIFESDEELLGELF